MWYSITMKEKVFFKEQKNNVSAGKIQKQQGRANGNGNFIGKLLVNLTIVIISSFLLYNVFKSIQISSAKLGILEQAEQEVDELRLRNLELLLKKIRVESEDYVETEARNRLNYARDGEIVFVIPESAMELAKEEVKTILEIEDLSAGAGEETKTIFEQWRDFFIKGV